ncbi:MAG: UDP-glucose/GDP-mannose dehydrogenase family protein [Planctomycetia bacterium]|nr:UDP-glucose/GDP-mannose dehydrogenase family protein [Planctomycetia bacterium]
MKITVVGTGYVGLVSGACFAQMGNNVFCVDTNEEKIRSLSKGEIPIYEPGLEDLVKEHLNSGELRFTTDLAEALPGSEIVFIAVGTPMGADGSADLQYVRAVAEQIGSIMSNDLIIVDKSTVPVGTAGQVYDIIRQALDRRAAEGDAKAGACWFDVVSNPEFLKEGTAVSDFLRPDRIVIGANSEIARKRMENLYAPFMMRENKVLCMDVPSAEMTKYAANAMLANRISFMNEIALLCEKVGANASSVRMGIGTDSRIGLSFLFPGCGYGGSCFPKDVRALLRTMKENGINPHLLEAVEKVNDDQKNILWRKAVRRFGEDLSGRTFAVWGLAFKPNTDDMREAPSVITIRELVRRGATVRAFDPEAMDQARSFYLKDLDKIEYFSNKYDPLNDADALVLITEWSVFRSPDFNEIRSRLKAPIIFDGRNQFERFELPKMGFEYYPIGIPGSNFED